VRIEIVVGEEALGREIRSRSSPREQVGFSEDFERLCRDFSRSNTLPTYHPKMSNQIPNENAADKHLGSHEEYREPPSDFLSFQCISNTPPINGMFWKVQQERIYNLEQPQAAHRGFSSVFIDSPAAVIHSEYIANTSSLENSTNTRPKPMQVSKRLSRLSSCCNIFGIYYQYIISSETRQR